MFKLLFLIFTLVIGDIYVWKDAMPGFPKSPNGFAVKTKTTSKELSPRIVKDGKTLRVKYKVFYNDDSTVFSFDEDIKPPFTFNLVDDKGNKILSEKVEKVNLTQ